MNQEISNTHFHPPIQRNCFLCDTSEGSLFLNEKWDVLGMGVIEKGFRCCENCGLILQDPAVPPESMLYYYKKFSNYTNQSRQGLPTERKKQAVDDQILFLEKYTDRIGSAFQIGCSDGYTLSQFKKIGWQVFGCEPSSNALNIAQKLWGINGDCTDFETYSIESKDKYDLIILTHVLEHLYNPIEILKKCMNMLKEDALLLIEVPLFIDAEHLPEGYFTFEHINYFSHTSLRNTINSSGFEVIGDIEDDYETDLYPVQRLVARRTNSTDPFVKEVAWAKSVTDEYSTNEIRIWHHISDEINKYLINNDDYLIWASGIHTSQLLCRCKLNKMPIAIVDTDPQKWGHIIKGIKVISPDKFFNVYKNMKIVISSRASEIEIFNYLVKSGIPTVQIKLLYLQE
jgi:SAM-dependent methyltransferase